MWKKIDLREKVYGYQIQPNTRWLSGHKKHDINKFINVVRADIPLEVVELLRFTRGLNKPLINPNADKKNRYKHAWKLTSKYYSANYVNNLELLESAGVFADVSDMYTAENPLLLPIYSHRYILVDNAEILAVLSIYMGNDEPDIIAYGKTLIEYLKKEFLYKNNLIAQ